jgi:hypothetical protein
MNKKIEKIKVGILFLQVDFIETVIKEIWFQNPEDYYIEESIS